MTDLEKWIEAALTVADTTGMKDAEIIPTWPSDVAGFYPTLTIGALREWQAGRSQGGDTSSHKAWKVTGGYYADTLHFSLEDARGTAERSNEAAELDGGSHYRPAKIVYLITDPTRQGDEMEPVARVTVSESPGGYCGAHVGIEWLNQNRVIEGDLLYRGKPPAPTQGEAPDGSKKVMACPGCDTEWENPGRSDGLCNDCACQTQVGVMQGLELAANHIERKADNYDREHGITDPYTGTREYPGDGADYYREMMELAEEVRALTTPGNADTAHTDDAAVDRFADAMKAKLAKKRGEGRGGWEDEQVCPPGMLQQMLVNHLEKGDPVDIGNFAMMIWNRGECCNADTGEAWISSENHKGMRISAEGVLGRVRGQLKFGAQEMLKHLEAMAEAFYSGNVRAVDQFLQTWDLDDKRPTPPAAQGEE